MFNDIPSGLRVGRQQPLDGKKEIASEVILSSLGTNNNLAYSYYEGLEVKCLAEGTYYEWREVVGVETGFLPSHFTYPTGLAPVNGVNYSGRTFNFFKIEYADVEDIIDYSAVSLGGGIPTYLGNTIGPGVSVFEFASWSSDTLIFDTSIPGLIQINTPSVSSLPDFIVNKDFPVTYSDWLKANTAANGGTPIIGYQYKGFGTLAKPYTDTHVFTLGSPLTAPVITANTAIQNALDAFVGSGTFLLPQFFGSRIKVQPSNSTYIFTGQLNYHGVILSLEVGTTITHEPIATSGENSWFINLDHSSITSTDIISTTVELAPNSVLIIRNNGFKNKGTLIGTGNFAISKILRINNEGVILNDRTIEAGDIAGDFLMFDLNAANTSGYKNDGNALLDSRGTGSIASVINPIYKGSTHVSDFTENTFNFGRIGFNIDPDIVPFESFSNGYIRLEKCNFYIFGNQTLKTLFKQSNVSSTFLLIEPLLNGSVEQLVEIDAHVSDPALDSIFIMYNGVNKDGFVCLTTLFLVNLTGGRTAKWIGVEFNNNYISKATIDTTKVDMTGGNTRGVVNYIGRGLDSNKQISMFLPKYPSRVAAAVNNPIGTMFINTNGLPNEPSDASFKLDIVI